MNNKLKKLAKFYKKASKMKDPVIQLFDRTHEEWMDGTMSPDIGSNMEHWRVTDGHKECKENEFLPCPFCGVNLVFISHKRWVHNSSRCFLGDITIFEGKQREWNTRAEDI